MKLALVLFFVLAANGLKILIHQPNVNYSHMKFHATLAEILTNAGHEVHILRPDWIKRFKYTGNDAASKIYTFKSNSGAENGLTSVYRNMFELPDYGSLQSTLIWGLNNVSRHYVREMITDADFIRQLEKERYDVGINQVFELNTLALFHHLNISVMVGTSAVPLTENIPDFLGLPSPRSYVPLLQLTPQTAPSMSYLDRCWNVIYDLLDRWYVDWPMELALNSLSREFFGENAPTYRDFGKKLSYIFVNTHAHFDHQRPTSHKIVHVGGIGLTQGGNLTAEIQQVFDSAKKGVILMSLGSNVDPKQMPFKMKEAFLSAFGAFPEYEFIFRHPGVLANHSQPENVHIFDWVPQTAILQHEKTRVFISHGGLNSVNEAAFAGVPLLVIPFFADQFYNAAFVSHKKTGIQIPKAEVSKEKIVQVLHELLHNPIYSKRVKYMAQKVRNNPDNPNEKFVKLIEYAANFGDHGELNLEGANLGFVKQNNLDIWIPFGAVCFMVLHFLTKNTISTIWTFLSQKIVQKPKLE